MVTVGLKQSDLSQIDTLKELFPMETKTPFLEKLARAKVRVILITVIIISCIATIYVAAANAYTVDILVDGKLTRITTLRSDAAKILEQANIEVGKDDVVDLSEFRSDADSKIAVYKACTVTVYDGDKSAQYVGNKDVESTFAANNIKLGKDDIISCEKTDAVYDGMEIVITRAIPVTVIADGKTSKISVAGGTVADALDKAVVTADDDDILSHPMDTALTPGMTVKVTRVTLKEKVKTEIIKFKTEVKKTATLAKGQSKIATAGVNGEKQTVFREKYVDGKLTESKQISSKITKAAVNAVKLVGTKTTVKAASPVKAVAATAAEGRLANGIKTISRLKAPDSLKLNGNVPVSYKRKITGTASAYSCGTHTATGKRVMPGYIAVNPRQIPYHTKMWIVSNDGKYVYGYASAEDTGGFVNWGGSRATLCDLFFSSESQCNAFGRRRVTIYIL